MQNYAELDQPTNARAEFHRPPIDYFPRARRSNKASIPRCRISNSFDWPNLNAPRANRNETNELATRMRNPIWAVWDSFISKSVRVCVYVRV